MLRADKIGDMAARGEDLSRFFTGKGKMHPGLPLEGTPAEIQRVNVDFTQEILSDLDAEAKRLNISRQAVIKTLVSDGLDRRSRIRVRAKKQKAS